MPGNQFNGGGKPYLRIVGGNIVQKVDKGAEGARMRNWETPNGKTGVTYEYVYNNWTGVIHGINFKDDEYGTSCIVELDDAFLTLAVDGRYFSDFASKLFSGNLSKPFTIHPYDMETDTGKKTGISLQQDGEKLKSFFYDGTKNINGFPEVDQAMKEKLKKNYWKVFFAEVASFLTEKLQALKFDLTEVEASETTPNSTSEEKTPEDAVSKASVDSDEGFIGDEDLPF